MVPAAFMNCCGMWLEGKMTEYEREAIKGGLKKYCELDTMAMVIIYEAWVDWVQ
jgi:hypothetical protein